MSTLYKYFKKIVVVILTVFTYFNLIMLILSLGIWHLAWLFMSIELLTGFSLYSSTAPLPRDLGFIIGVLSFSTVTFANLLYVAIIESFSKTFSYECLQQDLRVDRITYEEYKISRKQLLKNYILRRNQ